MKHALPCALALTALAVPLAACGGGGDEAASASDKEAERDAAQVRLQQCLREQGVELPRPGKGDTTIVRPSAAERRRVENALRGPCKKHRDKAFGEVTEEDRQEMRDRMAKFSACMRREGVDMPDIRPGGGEQGVAIRANRNSPRFRKAEEKCRRLAPRPPGGGPGGPGDGPRIQIGPPPGGAE